MARRSPTYKWPQEDKLTRSMWMRGLAIFYGCILLLLLVVFVLIKPSHVAQNAPAYRSVESAVFVPSAGDRNAGCSGTRHESCAGTLIAE